MLKKLGHWIYHNKIKTLGLWLVILVAVVIGAMSLGTHYNTNLTIKGIPSTRIATTIQKQFHTNPNSGTMKVVVKKNGQNGVNSPTIKKAIEHSINKVKGQKKLAIKSVANPYSQQLISKDQSTTYVDITFKQGPKKVSQKTIHQVERDFNNVKRQHSKVNFTGTVSITPLKFGASSDLIGMAIAFVLLMILFASFITAGMPILSALVGLISGLLIVGMGTNFMNITNFAQILTSMISLAVGIDYALFILNRYKTDLKTFKGNAEEALSHALSEAGHSVIFAATTVIVAVCGLSLIKINFLTQMGFAAALGVFFALCSALTFLPTIIALGKKHIKPNEKAVKTMVQKPNWFGRFLTHYPLEISVVALIILGIFAIPAHHMRLGMPYDGALPKQDTARQAYDDISKKFGAGINSPLVDVIKLNPKQSRAVNTKHAQKAAQHISKMHGVKMLVPNVNKQKALQIKHQVASQAMQKLQSPLVQQAAMAKMKPLVAAKTKAYLSKHPKLAANPQAKQMVTAKVEAQAVNQMKAKAKAKVVAQVKAAVLKQAVSNVKISKSGQYAMITLIPKKGSQSVETSRLAHHIKQYGQTTNHKHGLKMTLTGVNAINIDTVNKLNRAIPLFAMIIIVIAFILLMLVFHSLLIPLIAMLGFGMSLLASFGIVTLIMQDGFMMHLFGISKAVPIVAFLPVIVISLLFGLAMDYEVFIVSRAHEEYQKVQNNTRAILIAIQDSGPVVIVAALIMISVFGSFALNSDPTIKSMAIALAFGILVDAFLVRLIIVPCMIKLFGKANWWFFGRQIKSKSKK